MFENVNIHPYCGGDLDDFKEMFCAYFRNDFKIDISDDKAYKICSKIAKASICGITSLDILQVNEKPAGFIFYQIDSPRSDWCEREGWGFIRETYVSGKMRGKHLGTRLAAHAENILFANGAEDIYLTSDEAGGFWTACGYTKTDKVSAINHDPIYEKSCSK
jgi:ribosomal protein S18 acetylase RimI-like enzyme